MPYSPPAGNAVNFVRDQAAYTPPPGNHVDFHGYTEASYVAVGSGRILFSGILDTYSAPVGLCSGAVELSGEAVTGHGVSAGGSGPILLSGIMDTEVVIPTINAYGPINWGGAADVTVVVNSICGGQINWDGSIDVFTRPPQIDIICFGMLPMFSGSIDAARGVNSTGKGKFKLGGAAPAQAGRSATMVGKLSLSGSMQAVRGVFCHANGAFMFSGSAVSGAKTSAIASMDGGLIFAGSADVYTPSVDLPVSDYVFVRTSQENAYVFH